MSSRHTDLDTGPLYALSHLDALESEAVHIFREVAGEFENPVILFS
ncbi:sulfate adenylyltransferase subunit CysD, partial [Streptomyces sp. NPDC003703]